MSRDIEKYAKDYVNNDLSFEKILIEYRREKILEFLNLYKPKSILEIGCGVDSIANYYTDFKSFTIVEPSKKFAFVAVKNINDKIKIYVDFIENKINELKKQNFDFVILSSLLHEVQYPKEFLTKIASLCNENTILHINVPNSDSFHLLWAYEAGLISKLNELTSTAKKLQQNTTFNLTKLVDFIEEHNLKIIKKGSYFIKPFNHSKMLHLINEKIIDKQLLDGLNKMTKYMPDLGCEIFINCKIK